MHQEYIMDADKINKPCVKKVELRSWIILSNILFFYIAIIFKIKKSHSRKTFHKKYEGNNKKAPLKKIYDKLCNFI